MHQCIKCKKKYTDEDAPLLEGCKECGSRLFLYIRGDESADTAIIEGYEKEITEKVEEIKRMEEASKEPETKTEEEPPEKFGVETIKTIDKGQYEINLDALMKGRPIIVLSRGGSYIISLPSVFGKKEEIKLD